MLICGNLPELGLLGLLIFISKCGETHPTQIGIFQGLLPESNQDRIQNRFLEGN